MKDASEQSSNAFIEVKDASEQPSDAFIESKDASEQLSDASIRWGQRARAKGEKHLIVADPQRNATSNAAFI